MKLDNNRITKSFIFLCFCAFLIAFLSVSATAHSGGTDSDGGHYNGDDYHYHHGYSAHDHYDIDGDGDIDCPYDFDDKTGQNSGGSGSSTSSNSTVSAKQDTQNKQITLLDVLQAMIIWLFPSLVITLLVSCILVNIIIFILGEDRGCLVSCILSVIIFLVSYIWLICYNLK